MELLAGKAVLVTGAARGLGEATARRMASHGASVFLSDVLDEAGRGVARDIGSGAHFIPLDVTDEAAWGRAVATVVEAAGKIDVLVNNAAVLHMGTVEHTSAEQFRRVVDVNSVGPFLGVRTVVGPMKAAGSGSIVNVSSVDGLLPLNGLSAYVASKAALDAMTKVHALELGRFGIRVNGINPSGGGSEMFAPWAPRLGGFADELAAYGQSRGMPQTAVDLASIADAVVFLASDLARYISGVNLPVDGAHVAGTYLHGFSTL